jgi:hypothetical protein
VSTSTASASTTQATAMVATFICRASRRPMRCGETLGRTRIAELANSRVKAAMTGRGGWPRRQWALPTLFVSRNRCEKGSGFIKNAANSGT